MAGLVDRMVRAAKLDARLYEEVEADAGATGQALGVVVISALAAGVGAVRQGGVGGIVGGVLAALIGWVLWALVAYLIGAKLLPGPRTSANPGELLRTTGFASAPGVLRVLGIVPGLAGLAGLVASLWMLVAFVIAVRQALDYDSTGRAVLVCVLGWVVYAAVFVAIALAVGGLAGVGAGAGG